MYDIFLCYLRDFFIEKYEIITKDNAYITEKEVYNTKIWQYVVSCFDEHKMGIESLMACGYKIEDCFLREVLSGDVPIIYVYQEDLFLKSLEGKSELAPTVTFELPNKKGTEHLLPNRFMRIEFSIGGMAGTYYSS